MGQPRRLRRMVSRLNVPILPTGSGRAVTALDTPGADHDHVHKIERRRRLCIDRHSGFFGLHTALELAQSAVFSRMVTAAVLAAALLATLGLI